MYLRQWHQRLRSVEDGESSTTFMQICVSNLWVNWSQCDKEVNQDTSPANEQMSKIYIFLRNEMASVLHIIRYLSCLKRSLKSFLLLNSRSQPLMTAFSSILMNKWMSNEKWSGSEIEDAYSSPVGMGLYLSKNSSVWQDWNWKSKKGVREKQLTLKM